SAQDAEYYAVWCPFALGNGRRRKRVEAGPFPSGRRGRGFKSRHPDISKRFKIGLLDSRKVDFYAMPFHVYILQSKTSGRLYIGHTQDLERRMQEHAAGQTRSTRGRGPWK